MKCPSAVKLTTWFIKTIESFFLTRSGEGGCAGNANSFSKTVEVQTANRTMFGNPILTTFSFS
jgi:hypothetical protein